MQLLFPEEIEVSRAQPLPFNFIISIVLFNFIIASIQAALAALEVLLLNKEEKREKKTFVRQYTRLPFDCLCKHRMQF